MSQSCILFCRCTAGIVSDEKLDAIREILAETESDIYELHDLCAVLINQKKFLKEIELQYEQKIVIACYPRAVEKMLQQAGVTFSGLQVLNFRELSADSIWQKLSGVYNLREGNPSFKQIKSSLEVPAWFPVIDQQRCTSCGQCARFCLFGVYRFQNKKLEVVHPLNCKNLCPACGRTCPSAAIIFPRLNENTTLSGAVPGEIKIDLSGARAENMFSQLQKRSQNRRSVLKSGVMQQAEEERRRALEQLKNNNKN